MPTTEALEAINTDVTSEEEGVMLSDMEALADVAGDWKDHLPYEAALCFGADEKIRDRFGEHVDQCDYCAQLIDTIKPGEQLITDFEEIVRETMSDRTIDDSLK